MMNIIIGKGFESILFGLTKIQIIEQLGKPDKIYNLEYDECENDIGFEDHGLEFQFALGRLISINVACFIDDEGEYINPCIIPQNQFKPICL